MIDALERRAGRGEMAGPDEIWRSAHTARSRGDAVSTRTASYRLVLAACAALLAGGAAWAALDLGSVEVEATVSPAGETDPRLPHAPVVITGMAMVEAYETEGGGDVVGAPSVLDVYVAADGPAFGVAMVSTTASGGLEIRSHGLDGRLLVESAEFEAGRWRLGPHVGLDGPVDSVDLGESSGPMGTHHTTFVAEDGDEASIAVASTTIWEPLLAMLSADRPPRVVPVEVLGFDGLGVETADDTSIVLWTEGGLTYVAQSPAHGQPIGFEPSPVLGVEELAERIALTSADAWLDAYEGAGPAEMGAWKRFWNDEDRGLLAIVWLLAVPVSLVLLGLLWVAARLLRRGGANLPGGSA